GWALAAMLLAAGPLLVFFALNATSFFVSAALLTGVHVRRSADHMTPPRISEGLAALPPLPALAAPVGVLPIAVTISSGTWIVGVPELVRTELGRGAAAFSLVAAAYAFGSITAGGGPRFAPSRPHAGAPVVARGARLSA